jgi:hypothetical protein
MPSSGISRRVALVRTELSEEDDYIHDEYGDDMFLRNVGSYKSHKTNKQQTPWPLVRERTIPTERQPLVNEI